jgi:NNP family nitrate/nitrite transporter-like MFS transporter
MIPAIFRREADEQILAGVARAEADARARRRTTAVIGIAGAVGAFGGVGVNIAFRESFLRAGNADAAFAIFAGVYLVCAAITYLGYVRVPALPNPVVSRPAFATAFTGLGGGGLRGAIAHCTCARQRVCSTCE